MEIRRIIQVTVTISSDLEMVYILYFPKNNFNLTIHKCWLLHERVMFTDSIYKISSLIVTKAAFYFDLKI